MSMTKYSMASQMMLDNFIRRTESSLLMSEIVQNIYLAIYLLIYNFTNICTYKSLWWLIALSFLYAIFD